MESLKFYKKNKKNTTLTVRYSNR